MRGWVALGAAWAAAAIAVLISTQLSLVSGLIFHFHPIAIAAGAAWLYRRLNGERPCTTHAAAFLMGVAALLSASAASLRPAGLTDPDAVAAAIALGAIAVAAWILLRRSDAPVASGAREEA